MHSRFFLTYYFDRLGYSNRLTRGILRDFEIVCHICIRSVIFDVFLHTKPADLLVLSELALASRRAIRRTGAIRRKSKITICDTKKSRTMTASHPTTLNTQLNVDIPK